MNLTGYISNYIGYAFGENETIEGVFNFNSDKFDLNEWMTEEEVGDAEGAETEELELEVIEVPKR